MPRARVDRLGLPEPVEQQANAFFEALTADGGPRRRLLARPLTSARGLLALRRLPLLEARIARSGEGAAVAAPLRRSLPSRLSTAGATAVLVLPDTAADYLAGASKQTLRRKHRAAVKAGVRWDAVDDPAERRALLALADERERAAGGGRPVLDGLERIGLWLVARDADGRPLLLSVTPVSGDWAVLRYFRTLDQGPEASVARYALTAVLVEHLVARRVRYLADSLSPLRITPGVRHFQRMVGFRLVRIRLRRG